MQDNNLSSEEEANVEAQENGEQVANGAAGASADSVGDTEGMDTKAKALMHLLKTSSVSRRFCVADHLWGPSNANLTIGFCCNHVRQNEEAAGGGPKTGRQETTDCPRTESQT